MGPGPLFGKCLPRLAAQGGSRGTPALQALGYLFLFWQVRYLNVVRFFVVELQGGGNVVVSVQSTVPTVAQLLNQTTT